MRECLRAAIPPSDGREKQMYVQTRRVSCSRTLKTLPDVSFQQFQQYATTEFLARLNHGLPQRYQFQKIS